MYICKIDMDASLDKCIYRICGISRAAERKVFVCFTCCIRQAHTKPKKCQVLTGPQHCSSHDNSKSSSVVPNLSKRSWVPPLSLTILFPESSCPAIFSHLQLLLLLAQEHGAAGDPRGDPLMQHVHCAVIRYLYFISISAGSNTGAEVQRGKDEADVERRMRRGTCHSPKEGGPPSKQTSSPAGKQTNEAALAAAVFAADAARMIMKKRQYSRICCQFMYFHT